MVRSRWFLGLSLFSLLSTSGCGWLPGMSGIGNGPPGFAVMITAPESYRGSSTVTMRFVMPHQGTYGVSAVSSDIERIDVTLMEMGSIAVPPDLPLPMPGSAPGMMPTRPSGAPKGLPAMTMPAPEPAPLPSDMEQWPTILPDVPPQGGPLPEPTPSIPAPPPPRLEKPLFQGPPVVAKASVSRSDLDKGQGDVVFNSLKAGVYGIQLLAFDRNGQVIGRAMQSVTVLDGQTASVDTQLVLDGSGSGGNVAVGVTIVDGGAGSSGGSAGSGVATASVAMPPSDYWTPERMKNARPM